ncbi:DUF983 domain-containing protein [Egibacter rhizosphaerae]|uniref:DUF983 domain-containing protein n=1 Tax=Egibacter rhizosphaerae TaxID=1670831 RepID=UPI0013F176CC|nr:DUF983 domain-containing protein [Egibacter rhizosphaerae]
MASSSSGANDPGRSPRSDPRAPLPAGPMRMLARALRRRCLVCGGGGVFSGWFELRDRCPTCAMPFEREEGYWVGAMIVNIGAAQAGFFAFFIGGLLLTWPDPPWMLFLVGGVGLMIGLPIGFYPLSKQLWLWVDLLANPRGDAAAAAREVRRGPR